MLCYKDMTFCKADCQTVRCHRNKRGVPRETMLPVAWADFSLDCVHFVPAAAVPTNVEVSNGE
jgi:hypothetical protein